MASASALDGIMVTDSELAALAGCTTRHIRNVAAGAKAGRNSYAAGPALKLIFESAEGGGALGKKLMSERIRKVAADADMAELAFAKARDEVAPLAEFERAWATRYALILTNIMNVPARAVLQLLGCCDETEFKTTLRAELGLALKQSAEADFAPEMLDEENGQNEQDND